MNVLKKLLFFSMSFFLVTMSGCGQPTYTYKGEGDDWEGTYVSNQTKNTENGEFRFGYTGEGEVGKLDYKIISHSGENSGHIVVDGKTFTHSTGCSGCAKPGEHDEFQVVIEWDAKKDEFTLKRK